MTVDTLAFEPQTLLTSLGFLLFFFAVVFGALAIEQSQRGNKVSRLWSVMAIASAISVAAVITVGITNLNNRDNQFEEVVAKEGITSVSYLPDESRTFRGIRNDSPILCVVADTDTYGRVSVACDD